MAEPLTKAELALARGYAESVYADTTDPQKHAAAVMMLRLLDTLAALEAEVARLRQLAEVGEAVEAMPVGDLLWHVEGGWYTYKNAVNTKTGMQRDGVAFDENSPVVALAALRAAKGEKTDHAH